MPDEATDMEAAEADLESWKEGGEEKKERAVYIISQRRDSG